MHKVSIKSGENGCPIPAYVSIDDKSIGAVSVKFSQSVDTVPTFEIELNGFPDIEALADIQFQFTPKTVEEAKRVLRHSFTKDNEFYSDLSISIAGKLKEFSQEFTLDDLTKEIMDCIIKTI